jgi:hypothetical protein
MLAADFTDKLACPACGYPVQRFGRWYMREGEWYFTAEDVSAKKPHRQRPDYDGNRWTNYPAVREVEDKRTGVVNMKREDEWHYIVTHHCTRTSHDPSRDCDAGPFQREDCRRYDGIVYDWMNAPESAPTHKDATPVIAAQYDRQKAAAGDAA